MTRPPHRARRKPDLAADVGIDAPFEHHLDQPLIGGQAPGRGGRGVSAMPGVCLFGVMALITFAPLANARGHS